MAAAKKPARRRPQPVKVMPVLLAGLAGVVIGTAGSHFGPRWTGAALGVVMGGATGTSMVPKKHKLTVAAFAVGCAAPTVAVYAGTWLQDKAPQEAGFLPAPAGGGGDDVAKRLAEYERLLMGGGDEAGNDLGTVGPDYGDDMGFPLH